MEIRVSYDETQDCVMTEPVGLFTVESFHELIRKVAEVATKHPCRRLFHDFRRAEWHTSPTEFFYIPDYAVTSAADRSWRRAVLVREEDVSKIEFYETTAANKGLIVKIFTDYDAALAWLRELKV